MDLLHNKDNSALKEYSSLLEKVNALPKPKVYRNSTSIVNMCGTDLNTWEVITSAVISNLNILLIGERGEGKTQLQNELRDAYFGKATYIRMRDNFRAKDLFETYNLDKLFEGKCTVLEAKEKLPNLKNPLTIIDEINRAHEKVQNQVFDIYDGYIIFEGPNGTEKIPLGVPVEDGLNFHSAIASANVGYSGTSPMDSALLDRSHLILNIDNFSPTTIDNAIILSETITPKVIDYKSENNTERIVDIYRGAKQIKLSIDALVALLYLRKGIDYCIKPENKHSKMPVIKSLPDICEGCNELGKGCGYTYPVSTRTEKAVTLLAKGLKVMADAKSGDVQSLRVRYQDILGAFTLVAPYSGILDERWVDKEFMGNQQFAVNLIAQNIAKEISMLSSRMKNAYTEATLGELKDNTKAQFQERWGWYSELLAEFDASAKKFGNLAKLSRKEIAEAAKEHPILRWVE